jgi:hypothetical protein
MCSTNDFFKFNFLDLRGSDALSVCYSHSAKGGTDAIFNFYSVSEHFQMELTQTTYQNLACFFLFLDMERRIFS